MVHSSRFGLARSLRSLLCLLVVANLVCYNVRGFTVCRSLSRKKNHRDVSPLRAVNEEKKEDVSAAGSSSASKGSGNLITLLNFAQEVGNSNNQRFRKSADRLREQFVKSFALKYDLNEFTTGSPLATSEMLIDSLSNINDEELLCTEAKCIREIIVMQLDGIDPLQTSGADGAITSSGGGSSGKDELTNIIFFNEGIDILKECRHAPSFPINVCQPVKLNDEPLQPLLTPSLTPGEGNKDSQQMETDRNGDYGDSEAQEGEGDGKAPKRRRKRDVIRDNLGRFVPFLKPRPGSAPLEAEEEEDEDVFANIAEGQRDDLRQALASTEGETTEAADRRKQVVAANIAATLLRAKKAREAANPTLITQQAEVVRQVKEGLRVELSRWLTDALTSMLGGLGGELQYTGIPTTGGTTQDSGGAVGGSGSSGGSGKTVSPSLLNTKWSERKASNDHNSPTCSSWRNAIEAIEQARYIFPSPKPLVYQSGDGAGEGGDLGTRRSKDGSSVKMDIASDVHPNYAVLLHACLMASMASYNLDLLPRSFIEDLMRDIRFYDQPSSTSSTSSSNNDDSSNGSMDGSADSINDCTVDIPCLDLQDPQGSPQVTFPTITPDMDEGEVEAAIRANELFQQEQDDAQRIRREARTAAALQLQAEKKRVKEERVRSGVEAARLLGEQKAELMSRMALGWCSNYSPEDVDSIGSGGGGADPGLRVETIASDKACAVVSIDGRNKVVLVAFRGTKDSMDVITDINFVSQPFTQVNSRLEQEYASSSSYVKEYEQIEVHGGFLSAFDSIVGDLSTIIHAPANNEYQIIFTGHSMGGALAQLGAAYFQEKEPFLITFAAPAIGNEDFVKYINRHAQPYGGIRVWNEYDSVPYLALVVGYSLPGIPIKRPVSKECKDLFREECSNDVAKGMDVILPHILYQVGPVTYTFPILGQDMCSASSAKLLP